MGNVNKLSIWEHKRTLITRDSNLELFRIITMLLIVAHHYVVNSGLEDGPIYAAPTSVRSLFLLLFGAWGKIGINCFVMITGYFMCKSKITAKKFAKLVGEWLFYRYTIYLIFLISGYEPFSLKSLIQVVVPIYHVSTDFTSCFILFWLCIPFLNMLVSHLTERNHVYLLLLMGFIYIFLGTTHTVKFNYVTWFCVLYFIASYIRLYPKKWMSNVRICGILLLVSILVSVASVVCCAKLGRWAYLFVTDSNTLLAVFVGVFGFLFFKNINIPYSKFINTVAASTFGVLCIHANSDTMRQWLWKDMFDNVGHFYSSLMPIHAIFGVICIFTVCTIIDMIRIRFIEKPFFILWDKHWGYFLSKFNLMEDKIFKKMNVEYEREERKNGSEK